MWFLTQYEPFPVAPVSVDDPSGTYGAFVWALTEREAEALCARRRIGETIIGRGGKRATPAPYQRPSAMLKTRMTHTQKLEFLHGTCFLCFLASRSLGASVFETLGDNGLMHEAIHAMSHGRPTRTHLAEMLAPIERKVPGYWPGGYS